MAQNFTDDCFNASAVWDENMAAIEANLIALKTTFSGSSSPADAIAGMLWYYITSHILRIYNGTTWINVFNALTGRAADSDKCSGITLTAGSGLSGGGALSVNRTISHANHTGQVTGSTSLTIADNVIRGSHFQKGASVLFSSPIFTSGNTIINDPCNMGMTVCGSYAWGNLHSYDFAAGYWGIPVFLSSGQKRLTFSFHARRETSRNFYLRFVAAMTSVVSNQIAVSSYTGDRYELTADASVLGTGLYIIVMQGYADTGTPYPLHICGYHLTVHDV